MSNINSTLACALVSAAILLQVSSAQAYRPFDGTDADVAELGEFELELGPVHYYREGKNNYLIAPATVLNLGIIPRVEVVADLNDLIPIHPKGPAQLTGTDLLVKVLVLKGALQDQPGPSLAMEFGPLFPEVNGEKGFGASLNVILSERWGWFVAHLNNEPSLSRGNLRFTWFTSLITEGDFGAPVRPVAEFAWEREFVTKSSEYSALAGAIWSVHETIDLDAAVRVASVDKQAAFEGRLGLTWTIPVWKPTEEKPTGEKSAEEK